MTASPIVKVGALAASLSCLMIGNAWAQQEEAQLEIDRPGQSVQTLDRDVDRPATGQLEEHARQGQQYTANYRGTPTANQDQPVQKFLASCLLSKNKAEVELGKFAQQQAQNPQVKEFAQRMVQDHQQLVQKLQPLAKADHAQTGQASRNQSQFDAQRQASDTARLPGSSGAGQPGDSATSQATAGHQDSAIQQLIQIDRKITEQCSQALRQELEQKQGAEFDKAYVGSQIAGHMQMLSTLKVIEQQGPQQLQQIAQQAQPTIEQHLQHAKELKKQLVSGRPSSQAGRQAERTQR